MFVKSHLFIIYLSWVLHMFQLSRFKREASVLRWQLPFYLPEIFRFKMMLVWMSNIYDFFKMVTFFSNPMWKSWRVLLSAVIFIISSRSATKALIVLELAKEGSRRSLRINAVCIFKPMKSAADISG